MEIPGPRLPGGSGPPSAKLFCQGVEAGQQPADGAVPSHHQNSQIRHSCEHPQCLIRILPRHLHHLQPIDDSRPNAQNEACLGSSRSSSATHSHSAPPI